jgi:hypothetical protein
MSETRPPITAGPIERAFRFLKRTSVNGDAVGAEGELLGAAKGGVVLSGEVAGEPAGDGFISVR